MYSNEGAVDSTAVKMSQMVGVFLTGLGLASVTMRPAELDQSDLLSLRNGINSSISGLANSITSVNSSVDRTNTEVRSLVDTLEGVDVGAIIGAADTVALVSQQLQSSVTDIRSLLEDLDLSADVDLGPAIDRILSTHQVEMQRLLDIMDRLNNLETLQGTGISSVKSDLILELGEARSALADQIGGLASQLESLDVDVDLTPVLDATAAVKSVAEQHSANFDNFIQALVG